VAYCGARCLLIEKNNKTSMFIAHTLPGKKKGNVTIAGSLSLRTKDHVVDGNKHNLHEEAKESHDEEAHRGGSAGGDKLVVIRLLALRHQHAAILNERRQGDDDVFVGEFHCGV
jgi:hypothetical protein